MHLEEYFAQQAVHCSRRVKDLRAVNAEPRAVLYWENQVLRLAQGLMENLIDKAQCHRYDADTTITNQSEDI